MPALWWAALGGALAYVGLLAAGARGRIRAVKVLPALLLAGTVAPAHPLAAAALAVSAAGDGLLLDKDRFFLHGLVAFLVAHTLFVPAFLLASGGLPSPTLLLPLAAAALGLAAYLVPRRAGPDRAAPAPPGEPGRTGATGSADGASSGTAARPVGAGPRRPHLRAAVPVYALALVGMVTAAGTLGPLGLVGGLCFLVSDAVLAIRVFKRDFPGAAILVIVTYYTALLTLTVALTR